MFGPDPQTKSKCWFVNLKLGSGTPKIRKIIIVYPKIHQQLAPGTFRGSILSHFTFSQNSTKCPHNIPGSYTTRWGPRSNYTCFLRLSTFFFFVNFDFLVIFYWILLIFLRNLKQSWKTRKNKENLNFELWPWDPVFRIELVFLITERCLKFSEAFWRILHFAPRRA